MITSDEKLLERLMSKIQLDHETGCWNWTGALSRGYGILSYKFNKAPYKAHRLSYQLNVGEIPEGLVIRHKCDNRKCCNPNHLIAGTQKDNVHDTVTRGRLNPVSRLNLCPGEKGVHGAGSKSNKEILNHVSK
jgi:hypothetical protein